MKWWRWTVCWIAAALINEVIGWVFGVKLGVLLVSVVAVMIERAWNDSDKLKSGTYAEFQDQLPPAVREECVRLRGQADQLQKYLEECADQKIIRKVCIPAIIEEFAPQAYQNIKYEEISDRIPQSIKNRCQEFSGDRERMERYLNHCVESKLIERYFISAILNEFASSQAAASENLSYRQETANEKRHSRKEHTVALEKDGTNSWSYEHHPETMVACPGCGRQQSSLHRTCPVCGADMKGPAARKQAADARPTAEPVYEDTGLDYHVFERVGPDLTEYAFFHGRKKFAAASSGDVVSSPVWIRGSGLNLQCKRGWETASGTCRAFTLDSGKEYARLTYKGYGKHILQAGPNEIHVIPEGGGYRFYLQGVSIGQLKPGRQPFADQGGWEYRFTLTTSQPLPEQVVLLMLSFRLCRIG